MNVLKLFRLSLSVVKSESELWINYSAGINHKFNLARSRTPRYLVGFIPRIAIFMCWLVKRIRFSSRENVSKNVEVFVFAETLNQWTSLKPSLAGFDDLSVCYDLYVDHSLIRIVGGSAKKEPNICSFGLVELLVGFTLMLTRLVRLIKELREKDQNLISRRLNGFLTIYFWVPFFFVTLSRSKPRMILCSNDHNSANRSLLIVAHFLKIKTAYIQHASVSSRFHRLDFDYSFLDGKNAYEIYLQCECNTHNSALKNGGERWVFLSGVKRPLIIESNSSYKSDIVGVAFKEVDGVKEVFKLCEYIVRSGKRILLRYHPATTQRIIKKLNRFSHESGGAIMISSPYSSAVSDYLGSVNSVIASNSTMLLEAAMVDVKSIYYEFRPAATPDYYGYVEKGISFQADSAEKIVELIDGDLQENHFRIGAIQRYTHTYHTDWQNREGYLVASHLKDILSGKDPETLWSSLRF